MNKNSITGPYIKELQQRNKPPADKKIPLPTALMPDDLENQILSSDPLQRVRQLDQQEADRIERTVEEDS